MQTLGDGSRRPRQDPSESCQMVSLLVHRENYPSETKRMDGLNYKNKGRLLAARGDRELEKAHFHQEFFWWPSVTLFILGISVVLCTIITNHLRNMILASKVPCEVGNILSRFYSWGTSGKEMLSKVSRVTQEACGSTRQITQIFPDPHYCTLIIEESQNHKVILPPILRGLTNPPKKQGFISLRPRSSPAAD